MEYTKLACILCVLTCSGIEGLKILAVYPVPARSHYNLASRIVKELAARGHEVTVVNPFPQKTPIKNFKDLSVESILNSAIEQPFDFFWLEKQTIYMHGKTVLNSMYGITEATLKHEDVQKLLNSKEEFDLLLFPQYAHEGLLALAHRFKAPIVLQSTMPLYAWGSYFLGHPSPPSYVPNLISPYTGHMTFWQRFKNTYYDLVHILYHQFVMLPKHRELARKYIPGEPDLYDYLNNHSVTLLNSHVSIYDAIPTVPNGIEIGGFHISPPQELPADLKKFIDGSKNGVILFSMGSLVQSANFPPSTRDAILRSLGKLKQNVIWKFETNDLGTEIPKNVKIMKWIPQQDVLAHPNVRAFLSHGGLLSTTEAVYHGVPMVGIPIFVDQKMNMATSVSKGYAVEVPYRELTEERLSAALNEVLNNPKYKENILRRSKIMKDQPIPPLESAMFWIEYVARHNGTPHLKHGGMSLAWYQRYLLDVIGVYLIIVFITLSTFYLALKKLINCIKKSSKTDKRKKNN